MEGMSLGGELVFVSACLTVSPLITGGQAHTHTHTHKEVWGKSYTTELGCLAQLIPGVSKGTDTIVFIRREEVPIDRIKDVTHGHVCVYYRPEKDDPN